MAVKSLVICVDNSKECLKAVDFVLAHFPEGYTYHLLHVQPRSLATSIAASAAAAEFAYENMEAMEVEMVAASEHFLRDVFMPKAESAGAEVKPVVVAVHNDSSSNIGAAICHYAATVKADALVLMRENKSAVARFFLGSVTKYCASHSLTPIVIVPNKSL